VTCNMRHCSEEESYVLYLLYRRITAILMLRLRRIIILFFHIFIRDYSLPHLFLYIYKWKLMGIFFCHLYFFMSMWVGLTYFKQNDIISTLITLIILIMHTVSTEFMIPPCVSLCLDCVEFNDYVRMNRKAESKRETQRQWI